MGEVNARLDRAKNEEEKERGATGESLLPDLGNTIEEILKHAPNYAEDPANAEVLQEDGRCRLQVRRGRSSDTSRQPGAELLNVVAQDYSDGSDLYLVALGGRIQQLTMKQLSDNPDHPAVFEGGSSQNQSLAGLQLRHVCEAMGIPLPPSQITLP